ncbi:hypothetical protein KKA69_05910 [Patescibacteria group bacterium]|nr:hypothetical protein [Patescibacteria group bacterium]
MKMKKLLVSIFIIGLMESSLFAYYGGNIIKIGRNAYVEERETVQNVVVFSGDISIDGTVQENVVIFFGTIFFGKTAVVNGNIVIIAGGFKKPGDVKIKGNIVDIGIPNLLLKYPGLIILVVVLGFIALTILLTILFPKPITSISSILEQDISNVIFLGIVGVTCIVVVLIMFSVSVAGVVLIPVMVLVTMCAFVMGYLSVAKLIGKALLRLSKKPDHPVLLEVFLGVILLMMVVLMPFIGVLVNAFTIIIGLGGIIYSILIGQKTRK